MSLRLHSAITLTDIAKAASYSASHLTQLFRQTTGKSPIEHFLYMEMQAVSKDLYFTDRPIKDIAIAYGMEDPSCFSRLFKKIVGVSPQAYRNLSKG